MNKGTSRRRSAIAVRVPPTAASVRYRAYAQEFQNESTLDWLLARLRASAPPHLEVVCVCQSESEMDKLTKASSSSTGARHLYVKSRSDIHQCRLLMNALDVRQLVVAEFCHAFGPMTLIRDILSLHNSIGADLTDASCAWFTDPLYVVEEAMIDKLMTLPLVRPPRDILQAAASLRETRRLRPDLAPDFRWITVDVAKRYGIRPAEWPEPISVKSSRDIEILREVREMGRTSSTVGNGVLDLYKHASVVVRQRRLRPNGRLGFSVATSLRGGMRVLYVSSLSGFTGAQQSLCHLVGALKTREVQIFALTSYEGIFSEVLRRCGAIVMCPNHNLAKNDPENFAFARSVIAECRPDIVHINHTIGMPVISAATAAGIPLVQHVRVQTPWRLSDHICVANAVIAVSEFVRSLIARLDIDLAKVHVIMNGVDIKRFKPDPVAMATYRAQLKIPDNAFVVLLIARFARNKRHDTVIAAVSQLRRTTGRGHLLLVGAADGDREYLHQIETHCNREGLAAHTTMLEFIEDIRVVHHASDVLALPSENEPLSRAVLEAMAMGLPVVVGNSGGTQEVINPGVNGFIVPCGDAEQLAGILIGLALGRLNATAIGSAAKETIRASLTAEHCAERTMNVYRGVLRGM